MRSLWASPHTRAVLGLLALPLVLLLFNDAWSWDSPEFYDNHVYYGFFEHYTEFGYPFVENYKSSRLPFLYAGLLLYSLFSDPVAHQLLFLGFTWVAALAMYVWACRFGTTAAFVTAAAQTVYVCFHTGPSYHNHSSVAFFLLALALLERPARWRPDLRIMLAGGAFTCAVAVNSLMLVTTPMFAFLVLTQERTRALSARSSLRSHALGLTQTERATASAWARGLLRASAGGVVALAVLGLINLLLGGPFVFFLGQLYESMVLAGARKDSTVFLSDFATIWGQPWLTFARFVAVSSVALLIVQWRLGRMRLYTTGLVATGLLCLLVALATQAYGMGLLELQHYFYGFGGPMFVLFAATLAGSIQAAPSWRLFAGIVLLLIAPLSLFGGTLSSMTATATEVWQIGDAGAGLGFLILCGGALLVATHRLQNPTAAVLVLAASFGLANALSPPPQQPAYLYDLAHRCTFRRDFFDALASAHAHFEKFDADGQAHYVYPRPVFERPRFDGEGWCQELPTGTVPRAILLPHYFLTTAQFEDPTLMPPLRKLVVTAQERWEIPILVNGFQAKHPETKRYTLRFEAEIRRPTFSVLLLGYDVE